MDDFYLDEKWTAGCDFKNQKEKAMKDTENEGIIDVFDIEWNWLAQFRFMGDALNYCHTKGIPNDRVQRNHRLEIENKLKLCECDLNHG